MGYLEERPVRLGEVRSIGPAMCSAAAYFGHIVRHETRLDSSTRAFDERLCVTDAPDHSVPL